MAKRITKATKATTQKPIEQYEHKDKQRVNNPPVGLVDAHTDNGGYKKKTYQYDPHLDPQLQWAGKAEHTSFDVPTVSLHVHERIDPRRIIETIKKEEEAPTQMSLFEEQKKPLREAIEFYKHKENWSNRLIAGDSLLVMNSLLEKEGMGGKVQMVFFDPPYGIKYGSNFQPFVNKRDVKDGNDGDLTSEPEMLKAFRDTWELGLHSYLTYLRDRLLLAHQLLHDSGSVFVQISDENVHHIREILDEIFGKEQFVSEIVFTKTAGVLESKKRLSSRVDYLLWYCKKADSLKYRNLYKFNENLVESGFNQVLAPDGSFRSVTPEEAANLKLIPKDHILFRSADLTKSGPGSKYDVEFKGKTFNPGQRWWGTTPDGFERLIKAGRIIATTNVLRYVKKADDFPYKFMDSLWYDTSSAFNPVYVVQTNVEVAKRCILMTSDPGDVVLDITCGSGTTAFVAEQFGRRWITCDTSRVALTLTKQRIMTANFDYYELAYPSEGIGSGFKYKTIPHLTLKSIANNEPAPVETLYDQPIIDNRKTRVTGPFTLEAVPAPVAKSFEDIEIGSSFEADNSISRSGETFRQNNWIDELLQAGVRGKSGGQISFTRMESLSGTRFLQAHGETKEDIPKRVVVCFGPEHAPLEQRTVEMALEEARTLKPKPEIILFCAFHFDSEARKDIEETNWPGITLLEAQMNADLLTDDLKKKRSSNESFWLIGQPDVQIKEIKSGEDKGKYTVEVNGFDYYNPKTGTVDSGGKGDIAMWMLDHDYDGRSLFPSQVFFPMAGAKEGWATLAKNLKAEIDEEKIEAFGGTVALPFTAGKNVAVKIIDARGIESLKIIRL
jgi:adenine-specific DNA-methyltransferase